MQCFKACWFSWWFVCETDPAALHGSILVREGVTRTAVKTCDFEFGFPSTPCDSAQSFGRQLALQGVLVRGPRPEELMVCATLLTSLNSQKPIVALLC